MISGELLFPPTQALDSNFFSHLKEKQCTTNPSLAGFMSEKMLEVSTEQIIQQRLIQLALIALEIMGAGEKSDSDYVKVTKESIQESFTFPELKAFQLLEENETFAKAFWEASGYVEGVNEILNNFYETHIETEYVLDHLQVLFKAYWIETRKQKKQH
jgi:hypothetical protein